jgi:ADP-heptose:LPS heptosyltransferase
MSDSAITLLKFLVIHFFVYPVRRVFLFFFRSMVNRKGWNDRILLVHLSRIGDAAIFTSVLKQYKKHFKMVSLLIRKNEAGIVPMIKPLVDEILYVDYEKFMRNPFYGFDFMRLLRKKGFATAVAHDPNPFVLEGMYIVSEVGAEQSFCYEGEGIYLNRPVADERAARLLSRVVRRRCSHVIPNRLDKEFLKVPLANVIRHYEIIYEAVTGTKDGGDYSTALFVDPSAEERILGILGSHQLKTGSYCVIGLGAGVSYRCWPIGNFIEVAKYLHRLDIPVVLVGSINETGLAAQFADSLNCRVINLVGKTSLSEVVSAINHSLFFLGNETSFVHMSVAIRKPCICILGGGHFGRCSLYGYEDITRWVYKVSECLGDNWRCADHLGPGGVAPCVRSIAPADVIKEIDSLLLYLKSGHEYPKEKFAVETVPAAAGTSEALSALP